MLIYQNIGSWILDDMEDLHGQVRVFGEMLRHIEDLSKLIEFFEEKIERPVQSMRNRGRLLSAVKGCRVDEGPLFDTHDAGLFGPLLSSSDDDKSEGRQSPGAMDESLFRVESGKDFSNNTQTTCLRKRSPQPVLELDLQVQRSELYSGETFSEDGDVPKKKRGRHLMSNGLEVYLLEKMKAEFKAKNRVPERVWVVHQAREYTERHHVDVKCSKGWLDKFMKRNLPLINPGSAK